MKNIIEKKIEREEECWEEISQLLQDHKKQRISESNPTERKKISDRIEEIEKDLEEVEKKLKKLHHKKEELALSTSIPPTTEIETELEADSDNELVKALRLLKQKKEVVQKKHNPSKKELQEINKLEAEIHELMNLNMGTSAAKNSPRAVLTDLSVFFEEIVFSPKSLSQSSLEKIATIRNNTSGKNSWVDKSVIVSALTLRIIRSKKVISNDWNLLIDFLTDFEDDVWERALCGLVLAFQYHQNKMGRYPHLMRRLERLRSTPKIQEGLTKIDSVLLNKTYLSGFISEKTYTQSFFTEDPLNYFMPFYEEDNPILDEAFENDTQGDIDHSDLIEELKMLPYTNAYRYSLIQGLDKGELQQVTLKGEAARIVHEIFYMSVALAPFQNIIQEYYCFTKYFPRNTAQNLFDKQQSISKTKLKDILLAEKEKLFLTARAAFKDKKYITAIQSAKKGIELDGSDIRMLRILADSWIKKKEYMNAVLHLKALLKFEPLDEDLLTKLGDAYRSLEEYEKALKYFLEAKKLNPENSSYWNNTGAAYSDLKEYKKALKYFLEAKELNPENSSYWNNIGSAYNELKEHKKALKYCLKAKELNPKNSNYWNNIGDVYSKLKEHKKALEYFLKAKELNPTDSNYLNNLGVAYGELKEYKISLEHFSKAKELNPKNPDYWYNIGVAYRNLKEHKKALRYYLKAKELNPRDSGYSYSIGKIYSKLKDYKKAIEHLLKAKELNPENSDYSYSIGNIYSKLKDYKKAIEHLLKAKELNPENSDINHHLSWSYFCIGELQKSEEIINMNSAMEEYWESLGLMGHLKFQKGEINKAIEFYKKALDLCGNKEVFTEAYNSDIGVMEHLGLDIELYSSLLDKVLNDKKD